KIATPGATADSPDLRKVEGKHVARTARSASRIFSAADVDLAIGRKARRIFVAAFAGVLAAKTSPERAPTFGREAGRLSTRNRVPKSQLGRRRSAKIHNRFSAHT